MQAVVSDSWTSGEAYEAYIGRWSRPVAERFVAWLDRPPGQRWLDVGSGTGALTGAVLAAADPARVVGVEPSPAFAAHAAGRVRDPRASFAQGVAERLPVRTACVDTVVCGLVLNFVPDQHAALAGVRRVLRPGGVAGAYVWDYAGGMQLLARFWDAAVALDPAAGRLHEGRRFAGCGPERLAGMLRDAGLRDVVVEAVVVPTVFADVDDLWAPFLRGSGPAPAYVASLDDGRREALRRSVCDALPVGLDGSVRLTARAWCVRGRRPG